MASFAWVYILSQKQHGKAKTGMFFLPHAVMQLILEGVELGKADDIVFQCTNSKKKNGAVGILT